MSAVVHVSLPIVGSGLVVGKVWSFIWMLTVSALLMVLHDSSRGRIWVRAPWGARNYPIHETYTTPPGSRPCLQLSFLYSFAPEGVPCRPMEREGSAASPRFVALDAL